MTKTFHSERYRSNDIQFDNSVVYQPYEPASYLLINTEKTNDEALALVMYRMYVHEGGCVDEDWRDEPVCINDFWTAKHLGACNCCHDRCHGWLKEGE